MKTAKEITDGVLTDTSIYEFFLTDAELTRLSQELRT